MDQANLIAAMTFMTAFLSLIFTVMSSRSNDRKIAKISQSYFGLLQRAALSTTSAKYVASLSSIKTQYDSIANELSQGAGAAYRAIYDTIDKYDTDNNSGTSLRHAFDENISIIRKAYDFEFTYQHGIYLIDQLRTFKYIDRKDLLESEVSSSSYFSQWLRPKKKNLSVNEIIFQKDRFNKNLIQLYRRIPASSEPRVFSEAMEHTATYIKLHESRRAVLRKLCEQMDLMERENHLEIFNIHEVPKLGESFRRTQADMKRLIELGLVDFLHHAQFKNYDGLSHLIYIGSVLYIVNQHHSWGLFSDRMAR